MKKMIIPITILCAVIGLLTLLNGEAEIKPAPVPTLTVTRSEVTDVPEPVIELAVASASEIIKASADTEKPVVEVTKPTPTPEPTPAPLPTPVQTPVPAPTTAPVSAPTSPQPVQAGNMVYVEGFGWLESQGEGTMIHDDRMYENGNKVGIMD